MLRHMAGPIWLSWLFAGVMFLSALYHAGRLVATGRQERSQGSNHAPDRIQDRVPHHGPSHGPPTRYDDDLAQLVMSSAMAAMLVISFSAQIAMAWAVVLAVPLLWFILRAARLLTSDGWSRTSGGARAIIQPIQQVPMLAAMMFMLAAAGGSSASAAPAAPQVVTDGGAMSGMVMPGMTMGGQVSPDLGGSTAAVAVISLVLVGFLCLVAARHARALRAAVATQRVSLGCQLAMSGTMIYLLALMI
jgi:hypothetical protein